jgi:hypothetical protein
MDTIVILIIVFVTEFIKSKLSPINTKKKEEISKRKQYIRLLKLQLKNFQANSTFVQKTLIEREINAQKKILQDLRRSSSLRKIDVIKILTSLVLIEIKSEDSYTTQIINWIFRNVLWVCRVSPLSQNKSL